jgi:hypothetical protein
LALFHPHHLPGAVVLVAQVLAPAAGLSRQIARHAVVSVLVMPTAEVAVRLQLAEVVVAPACGGRLGVLFGDLAPAAQFTARITLFIAGYAD